MKNDRSVLAIITQYALLLFIAPVCLGLVGVLLPAAGYFPALGGTGISIEPLLAFLSVPGLGSAVFLSLSTGLIATLLSFAGAVSLLLAFWGRGTGSWLLRCIGPIIAVPPTAIAAGYILLLAPSGWVFRLLSPEVTGFNTPPPYLVFPDPHGFGLVLTLFAKETPFILLLCLAALARLPASEWLKLSASLGYGRLSGFLLILLPQIYRQIRLPLLAVLVFSISVVELPLLLGPTLPPPLSVLVFYGFQDADLSMRFAASVGAVLQFGLVILAWGIWRCGERLVAVIAQYSLWKGRRGYRLDRVITPLGLITMLPMILFAVSLCVLLLWSVAQRWPFSANFPVQFTFSNWREAGDLFAVMGQTAWIAFCASCFANGLMLIWLHARPETRVSEQSRLSLLIYLPLLVPQISFLFGLQIGLSWLRLDGYMVSVIWAHAIFILPYSYLILAPADAAFDTRYMHIGASFGRSSFYQLIRIKWMMMMPAIGASLLIGIAVSISLYLPTLFAGAGRITTLTVEAVGHIQSGARAYASVAVLLQLTLPLVFFGILSSGLYLRFRQFAGMQGGQG